MWYCAAFKTLFFSSNFLFPRGVFCPITSLGSLLECRVSRSSCRAIPGEATYLQKCIRGSRSLQSRPDLTATLII